MLVGGENLIKYITGGVPARFNEDGSQVNTDEAIAKSGSEDAPIYHFPLIENIIDPLVIEGAVYDLRLGEAHVHSSEKTKLYIDSRNTGNDYPLTKRIINGKNCFLFEKSKYYLCKTIESVNLSNNFQGLLFPRTTMFRSGIQILSGTVQPNYFGPLTFGLKNMSDSDIFVEVGFRCLSIGFEFIDGASVAYNGNWQSGEKTGTNGVSNPAR